jgi:DinB superfamily
MRIESTAFGVDELDGFLAELEDADRLALIKRLRRASARLAEVGARIEPGSGGDSWSAHEVLAHIAVLSKFYGMLTYKIGRGEMTELDLLGGVTQRDVFGQEMAKLSPAQLLESALNDHRRTIAYLESAGGRDLRRTARLSHGGEMSAADIARLPLCAHLEEHISQIERELG